MEKERNLNSIINDMLKMGILISGRKAINKEGLISFERLSNEEIKNLDESEIAYATRSMGRAIFSIADDGQIVNYKGVNSCLREDENIIQDLTNAKVLYIPILQENGRKSKSSLCFIVQVDKKGDMRIKGLSPLEDIEIEANINFKMQGKKIKLPKILSVIEIPNELSKKLGLPIKISGNYNEFKSDYRDRNEEIKENLNNVLGNKYKEDKPEGLRAETMEEYVQRLEVSELEKLQKFAEENNLTIKDFTDAVDESYQLGQRYGQGIRILENPFRIADLEYYTGENNIEAINLLMEFSKKIQNQELQQEQISIERLFARQMGENIANMMNTGWICENLMHRQDYSLAAEMCDDSYINFKETLEDIYKVHKDNEGAIKIMREQYIIRYFVQFHLIGSNIKVLKDAMKLTGKSETEIEEMVSEYVRSFAKNIDFEKVGEVLSITQEEVKEIFEKGVVKQRNNYVQKMSRQINCGGEIEENEQIIQAHENNTDFYNELSERLGIELEKSTFGLEEITSKFDRFGNRIDNLNNRTDNLDRTTSIRDMNKNRSID